MKGPWGEEGTELNTNHSEGLFRKRGTVSNLEIVPTPHNSEEVLGERRAQSSTLERMKGSRREEGTELNTNHSEGLLERRRHRVQH